MAGGIIPTERGHLPVRWLILFLLCMALIGSYYCKLVNYGKLCIHHLRVGTGYDNPSALQNQVRRCVPASARSNVRKHALDPNMRN